MFSCAFLDGQNRANRFFQCWLHFTSSPCQITPSNASVKTYENAPDPPGGICHETKNKAKQHRLTLAAALWLASNVQHRLNSSELQLLLNQVPGAKHQTRQPASRTLMLFLCKLHMLHLVFFESVGVCTWRLPRIRCAAPALSNLEKKKQVFKSSSLSKSLSTGPHSPTWFHYDHCVMLWQFDTLNTWFWYTFCDIEAQLILAFGKSSVVSLTTGPSKANCPACSSLGKFPQAVLHDKGTKEEAIKRRQPLNCFWTQVQAHCQFGNSFSLWSKIYFRTSNSKEVQSNQRILVQNHLGLHPTCNEILLLHEVWLTQIGYFLLLLQFPLCAFCPIIEAS